MPKSYPQLAKLTRPRLHKAVARERLFSRLDEAKEHSPAICVIGPPGAGKTTLVASWLDARAMKGIWYQVDAGDVDLATFFYYLGHATWAFTRKGQRPLPLLAPEYLHDVEGFSRRFFRGLFSRLPHGAALVLDNYQEVRQELPFHQLIAQAVDEVPKDMTLIAISRRAPPETYSRLVANENVQLVEWEDLKLTFTEALSIAQRKGQFDVSLVRRMHAQADGWAAGLTLMLERAHTDSASPLDCETHQGIFDYFAAQIFSKVTEETRGVLISTAWLPSVSADVAEALTGNRNAGSILEDLCRRHFFVHRRAGEKPSFHYHALFRHFLKEQASRGIEEGTLKAIKIKAGKLIEETGDAQAAFELFCESAAWDHARRLCVLQAPKLLAQGRWKTLQEWAARLPERELDGMPWLKYWLARSNMGISPATSRSDMLNVLSQFEYSRDVLGQILSVAAIIESHWVEWLGVEKIDPWIDRALQLLASNPPFPDPETEMRVMSILMFATSVRKPRSAMLHLAQDRITALLDADLPDDTKLLAGSVVLGYLVINGDLSFAARLVDKVGPLAERATVGAVPRLMWLGRLSSYYAEQAEYEYAWQSLARAEALSAEEGLQVGAASLSWFGVYIGVASAEPQRAERYVTRLENISGPDRPFQWGLLHNTRCMTALARHDVQQALVSGRSAIDISRSGWVVWTRMWFAIPAIYAMIEAGEYREAERNVAELREFTAGTFAEFYAPELLFAEAYIALKSGRLDTCHQLLQSAITDARERNYIFYFRSAFRAHRVLLCEAFRSGIESEYLRRIVRRFKLWPEEEHADENWPWEVKVFTFGQFDVHVENLPLRFGRKAPRKPMALLKALIAFGGESVAEQKLLDALWPDEEGDTARRALSTTLHRLRKLLGDPQLIQVEDGKITLDRRRVWVDALRVNELLKVAFTHGGDMAGLKRSMETVRSLYRGAFLPGEFDSPWSVSMREQLRSGFVWLVERYGMQLESTGQWREAADWYLHGLQVDDLNESLYQGLMRLYLHTGRHAEGLSTFRRLRQTLSVTLGIKPSPGSEALYRALQSQ